MIMVDAYRTAGSHAPPCLHIGGEVKNSFVILLRKLNSTCKEIVTQINIQFLHISTKPSFTNKVEPL